MRKFVSAGLVLVSSVLLLAGCATTVGSDGDGQGGPANVQPTVATTPEPVASYFKYNDLTPESSQGRAFLKQFKKQVPQLAGTNRPDKYVLKNGTGLCAEISYEKRQLKHRMTTAEQVKFVMPRVVGGSVTRKAKAAEAKKIVKISLTTVCAEFK